MTSLVPNRNDSGFKRDTRPQGSDLATNSVSAADASANATAAVEILTSKTNFIREKIAAGDSPTPSQTARFLRGVVALLVPQVQVLPPEAGKALEKEFAAIGWDMKRNEAMTGTVPPSPEKMMVCFSRSVGRLDGGNKITPNSCVDIGINITSKQLKPKWREIVRRAVDSGVHDILLTGTNIKSSLESLEIARTWMNETGGKNLFSTVGIHPHDAKFFDSKTTINKMKSMLNDPLAVAVGECGLDYNRNFSPKKKQLECFRAQLKLAIELQFPIFLHEREAFEDTIKVFDEFKDLSLPPVVVHCFTGTLREAQTYIERGFFIGFTGTICKKQRGAPLREILPKLPLERLMVETDAPYMGFLNTRRSSEPADVILVAEEMAKVIGVSSEVVRQITTKTAKAFFRLGNDI